MSITTDNEDEAKQIGSKPTSEAKQFVSFTISKVGHKISNDAGADQLLKLPETAAEENFANKSDCANY